MARGWESKSVESQQADRDERRPAGPTLSPSESSRVDRRQTLELSLRRAKADLAAAKVTAHRAMLKEAIRALEEQLSRV